MSKSNFNKHSGYRYVNGRQKGDKQTDYNADKCFNFPLRCSCSFGGEWNAAEILFAISIIASAESPIRPHRLRQIGINGAECDCCSCEFGSGRQAAESEVLRRPSLTPRRARCSAQRTATTKNAFIVFSFGIRATSVRFVRWRGPTRSDKSAVADNKMQQSIDQRARRNDGCRRRLTLAALFLAVAARCNKWGVKVRSSEFSVRCRCDALNAATAHRWQRCSKFLCDLIY